jgi:S1-C subfamily serine protease
MRCALLTLVFVLLASIAFSQDWSRIGDHVGGVVRIEALFEPGQIGKCSGSIVNLKKGYVVTAAHCIPDWSRPSIAVNKLHAEVVRINYILDLAVLQVDGLKGRELHVHTAALATGMPVAAIGYAFGALRPKFVFGHISDLEDESLGLGSFFDVGWAPGCSGGPIVDLNGDIVSISQAHFIHQPGIGVGATPEMFKAFVRPYLPAGAKKPVLGPVPNLSTSK